MWSCRWFDGHLTLVAIEVTLSRMPCSSKYGGLCLVVSNGSICFTLFFSFSGCYRAAVWWRRSAWIFRIHRDIFRFSLIVSVFSNRLMSVNVWSSESGKQSLCPYRIIRPPFHLFRSEWRDDYGWYILKRKILPVLCFSLCQHHLNRLYGIKRQ